MSDLLSAPIEVWLAAAATMAGVLGMTAAVIAYRTSRTRWQHIRPPAPVLNARAASLQASRTERFVAPLVDGLAGAAQRVLRPSFLHDAESALEKAGPGGFLTPRRLVSTKLLMIPLGAIVGFLAAKSASADLRLLAVVGMPVLTWQLPGMYLKQLAKSRGKEITRELPDTLDQITISVSAGLGLEAAMGRVAGRSKGPLGAEIGRTLKDIRIGVDRAVAYQGLARRSTSEDLSAVVSSLVQCLQMGTPLAPVLKARATELRRKRRAAAEEKAHKLSVKLSLPTALCILPALMMIVMGPTIVNVLESGFTGGG